VTVVLERRTFSEPVEFRKVGDKLTAAGYAAKFNKLSQNLGGFVEQVAPGAFSQTITQQDVRALFNHDENNVLGRMGNGALRLEEDEVGLAYEIDLPATRAGQDVALLLERKDVAGSSFGFRVIEDEWGETEQGFPLRTLKQVSLRDVGPVTFPAYTDTEAALRSLAEARSLDINDLVAAAQDGTLHDLIVPPDDPTSQRSDDDGREPPTVSRERIAWLTS
jgi:HK97 family phage prohead protease